MKCFGTIYFLALLVTLAIFLNSFLNLGANGFGELGYETSNARGDLLSYGMGEERWTVNLGTNVSLVSAAVGSSHSCAVVMDARLSKRIKCWGNNLYGQLGLNTTENMADDSFEVGDKMPYVELGIDIPSKLALGLFHRLSFIASLL